MSSIFFSDITTKIYLKKHRVNLYELVLSLFFFCEIKTKKKRKIQEVHEITLLTWVIIVITLNEAV